MDSKNWQLQCSEMKQRGAHIFKSKQWADCSFRFGTEKEKATIKAHKLILAMASPVFANMFYGEKAFKDDVPVLEIRPEVFTTLLEYVYSDDLKIRDGTEAIQLYYAAKKYRLPYVAEESKKYLSRNVNTDTVCQVYELLDAEYNDIDKPLKKACLQIFSTQTKELLKTNSFLKAKLYTVLKVFSLDSLNIESELDLFRAAVRYADNQESIQDIDDSKLKRSGVNTIDRPDGPSPMKKLCVDVSEMSTKAEDSKQQKKIDDVDFVAGIEETRPDLTLRKELVRSELLTPVTTPSASRVTESSDITKFQRQDDDMYSEADMGYRDDKEKRKYRSLVQQIRFLTLTPRQFSECPVLSALLTDSEILSLSMNISSMDTFARMPKDFSTSTVVRHQASLGHQDHQYMKLDGARSEEVIQSTIPNFTSLTKYKSVPFYFDNNFEWTLRVYHKTTQREFLTISATCFSCFSMSFPDWMRNTEVSVKFYTHEQIPERLQKITLDKQIGKQQTSYGIWKSNVKWSDIINPDYSIIQNDTVTYELCVTMSTTDRASS